MADHPSNVSGLRRKSISCLLSRSTSKEDQFSRSKYLGKMGERYQNDMYVGDINNGLLYRFVLNEARDDLTFDNRELEGNTTLFEDRKVNDPKENQPFVFGQGFRGITNIEVGPDGYLYVLSYTGSLFRILPSVSASTSTAISDTLATTEEVEEQQQDTQQSPESDNDQVTADSGNSIPAVILGLYGDRSYSPNPITIERGQTVTWYNGDTISHSVTSGQGDDEDAGEEFDSKARYRTNITALHLKIQASTPIIVSTTLPWWER